jgi:hypothetical protein
MGVKTKKVFAWIGIVLLAIIALGLGTRAIFNYIYGKKLERYLAELKDKGKIVRTSATVGQCADQDNAALPWKAVESLLILEPDGKNLLAGVSDISEWKKFTPEEKKKLEALREKNRKVIELILEASARKCFQYSNSAESPFVRGIPKLPLMIQATRLLIIDALFKAENGQVKEAIDQILKGISFMKLCSDSSILLNHLISMANTRMLVHNLNRIISGRELPAATLTKIMDSLDAEAWRKAMVRALEAEHTDFCLETYKQILKGEIVSGINSKPADRIFYWIIRPVLKSEVIWVSKHYEELIEAAYEPFYKNEKAQLWAGQEVKIPAKYKLAELLLPNLYTIVLKEATLEAFLDAAKIGVACRIYRSQHGKYPEKISDLVPEILKEEPLDPFTGQPLIYRTKENGFIVYSVGSNKKDDNGKMSLMTQAVMEKDDDWSWQENWQ